MIKVEFLGPIKKEPLEIEINTLEELSEILKQDQSLHPWLKNSAIAVNDVLTKDKTMKLKEGDKESLLPPVCGG